MDSIKTGVEPQNTGDIDPQKDFLVFYEHLLDDIASGFTLFYYNGTTHGTVTPTGYNWSSYLDQ